MKTHQLSGYMISLSSLLFLCVGVAQANPKLIQVGTCAYSDPKYNKSFNGEVVGWELYYDKELDEKMKAEKEKALTEAELVSTGVVSVRAFVGGTLEAPARFHVEKFAKEIFLIQLENIPGTITKPHNYSHGRKCTQSTKYWNIFPTSSPAIYDGAAGNWRMEHKIVGGLAWGFELKCEMTNKNLIGYVPRQTATVNSVAKPITEDEEVCTKEEADGEQKN